MSRKGGYKIIDLKGLDFSEDMVIKGIHESIEDNYGKPLLFSGIVIDGVEKDDVFANAVVNGDGYDVLLYGQTLHISNVDVVSLNKWLKATPESDTIVFNTLDDGFYVLKVETIDFSTYMFYFYYDGKNRFSHSTIAPFEDLSQTLKNVYLSIENNVATFVDTSDNESIVDFNISNTRFLYKKII